MYASSPSGLKSLKILESRVDYRPCHIRLPLSQERLAAIAFQNCYYSFFRVERDRHRAIEIGNRLVQRGHTAILTKVPKAYAIWVLEPDAQPEPSSSRHSTAAAVQRYVSAHPMLPPTAFAIDATGQTALKILTSPTQYQSCHITVPDLDKRLAAIHHEGKYYSMFKSVDGIEQALELIKRLHYRGDESLVTKAGQGYTLWILEPEAIGDRTP